MQHPFYPPADNRTVGDNLLFGVILNIVLVYLRPRPDLGGGRRPVPHDW